MLFRIAGFIPVFIVAVLAANEASARRNQDGTAYKAVPTTRAKEINARQHKRHLTVRVAPAIIGCYGFDHGPVYSPKPCNFPYNCEMFDGACGPNRAWSHTINP
jgi:hypothetical protein